MPDVFEIPLSASLNEFTLSNDETTNIAVTGMLLFARKQLGKAPDQSIEIYKELKHRENDDMKTG